MMIGGHHFILNCGVFPVIQEVYREISNSEGNKSEIYQVLRQNDGEDTSGYSLNL